MIPVARYLPLRRRARRTAKQLLIGFAIGASGVAGFVLCAKWLAKH